MSGDNTQPTPDGESSAPAPSELVDAGALGSLDPSSLAAALRPLWEDAGPLAERLVGRPVTTWCEHLTMAEAEIWAMDPATQAALLRAHPRIGADPTTLARRGTRSFVEQGGDRATDPAVLARLDELNSAYEDAYGFPFVEWVAGRPKEAIVSVLEQRSTRPLDVERRAGCQALVDIARDRLHQLRSGPL
jgi:2-oxo-4-hydroxy-4-carboxy--5-ureidoimidazoline (OHCU) decarboxylase